RQGEAAAREAEAARADGEAQARKEADRPRAEVTRQLGRARRFVCTAQLMRVAAVMERDPGLRLELLPDCNACPLDLRDFAWGWEEGHCRRERRLLLGHTGSVRSVAFSGDGKLLASGGEALVGFGRPSEIKLWDVASGQEKTSLKGHIVAVSSLAFS